MYVFKECYRSLMYSFGRSTSEWFFFVLLALVWVGRVFGGVAHLQWVGGGLSLGVIHFTSRFGYFCMFGKVI